MTIFQRPRPPRIPVARLKSLAMSENVAKKVQHQIELKDRPRRNDWTRFSQGLAQILRGSYHRVNNASLSESLVMKLLGKLRQQVVIQGAEKTVRLVMRSK